MARQEGSNKLRGRIGDITYYKTKTGYFAKRYTSPVKALQQTAGWHRSIKTFANSSNISKNIRDLVSPLTHEYEHRYVYQKLNGLMQRITKTDKINETKYKKVTFGELGLLKGFEFSKEPKLRNYLHSFPRISQEGMLLELNHEVIFSKIPPSVTHFKMQYHVIMFNETWEFNGLLCLHESDYLPVPKAHHVGDQVSVSMSVEDILKGVEGPVVGILMCTMEFFDVINGEPNKLYTGSGAGFVSAWRLIKY
ncbi:hypothetical protein [Penaeicola halotolerans]|uniref:hypothetical protein n=1 Tax=Penaeicola halotolerans TaxID=2793196 RepID=UPI001CF8D3A3|nr:hypothetical protein [Penaeicola halotolerans]